MTALLMLSLAGAHAAPLPPPPTQEALAAWPSPSVDGGTLLVTWLESVPPRRRKDPATWAVRFSRFEGGWSSPVTLAAGPEVLGNGADRPGVVAGGDGALYGWWPETLEGGAHASGVQLSRSTDGGASWTGLGWLHDDTSPVEHGFVSMVPVADGVQAWWLDGRATLDGGPTALRTTRVGAEVAPSTVVDERACDCCATGAAVGPDGTVVAWRDRDADEVRDIGLAIGGDRRQGSTDGWTINGCPVNGPSVAATPDGAAVAWFTGAGETPRVLAAFVGPAGLANPILVDGTTPLGQVDTVMLSADEVVVSWLDQQDEVGMVLARRVARDGRIGDAVAVGRSAPSRRAGVPQVERLGDDLIWLWTVPGADGTSTLASRRLALADLPAPVAAAAVAQPQVPAAPPRRPALQATTLDGQPLDLDDYAGRPLLVNVWATWCGPCVQELPHLAALAAEHPALAIVGVSVDLDGREDQVAAMVERFALPYPVTYGGGEPWARRLGITNVPVTWLYSPDGELLWFKSEGFEPTDPDFQAALAQALAGR